MNIEKILNNNVVMTKNESGEEIVCMGRGLAFQKKLVTLLTQLLLKRNLFLKIPSLRDSFSNYLQIFH